MAEKKKARATKKTVKRKKPSKKAEIKKEAAPVEEVKPKEIVAEKAAAAPLPEAPQPEVKIVPKGRKKEGPKGPRYYGTGRRKEAIAKVWLLPGSGNIVLNGRSFSDYFCGRKLLEYQVTRPLVTTNTRENYDVLVKAYGGGVPAQAVAVSLGIARALLEVSPDFRVKLKREGLLRRDPRMKERKKYGLKRARKAFQYTKR